MELQFVGVMMVMSNWETVVIQIDIYVLLNLCLPLMEVNIILFSQNTVEHVPWNSLALSSVGVRTIMASQEMVQQMFTLHRQYL